VSFITLYSGASVPESAKEFALTWPDLAALLLDEYRVTACVLPSMARPGDLVCVGKTCSEKDKDAWGPHRLRFPYRLADNVTEITFAVIDLDHITLAQAEDIGTKLFGWECVVHITHSHRLLGAEDNCLRVVMPLSRPVSPEEWRRVLCALIAELDIPADPTCKNLDRLYYFPAGRADVEPFSVRGTGRVPDVEALLARSEAKAPPLAPIDFESLVDDTEPDETELGDLRKAFQGYRRRKGNSDDIDSRERYEIATLILEGKPLASFGARQVTLHRAMSILAFGLPLGTGWPAAFEVLRASITAMDTEPEGLAYWVDKAYNSYLRGVDARAEQLRIRDEQNAAIKQRFLERLKKPRTAISQTVLGQAVIQVNPGPEIRSVNDEEVEGDGFGDADSGEVPSATEEAWEGAEDGRLIMTTIKGLDGKPKQVPKSCSANARVVLTYDPLFAGFFQFNNFNHKIEVTGGIFKDVNPEVLGTEVNNYLQSSYSIDVGSIECERQILASAYEMVYDPLIDYLTSLKWDGRKRIATFFEDYCDVVTKDADGNDITEHIRRISEKFFVGAAARGITPGRKVDIVLVIEGDQGIRKSMIIERLGGQFYAASSLDVSNKDTKMMAGSTWLLELAELSAFHRAETEAQKAFFSMRVDKYRLPYGRTLQEIHRRCVCVGTTNAMTYLVDDTGNRRYWPIRCGWGLHDGIKKVTDEIRDQLWAEAVHYYLEFCKAEAAGVDPDQNANRWWLDREEQKIANQETDARMEETSASLFEGKISNWWYNLAPARREMKTRVYMAELAEEVLKIPYDRAISRAVSTAVGLAMRNLGFTRKRHTDENNKRVWGYEPTEEMIRAPRRDQKKSDSSDESPPPTSPLAKALLEKAIVAKELAAAKEKEKAGIRYDS